MNQIIRYGPMLLLLGLVFTIARVDSAWAVGTRAGTVITNVATASYEDANGNSLTDATSNQVSITVLAVAAIDVSPATQTQSVSLGDTVYHSVQVTNQGNEADTITVDLSQLALEGQDDWSIGVYDDRDSSETFTGADTLISSFNSSALPQAGFYTISNIDADSSFQFMICYVTPGISVLGDSLQTRLTGTTKAKTNGVQTDQGDQTSIVKAANPEVAKESDAGDGTNVEPGDFIIYEVILSNDGNDTSYATTLIDTIPNSAGEGGENFTDYVASSVKQFNGGLPTGGDIATRYANAGAAKTDGADADSIEVTGVGGEPEVVIGSFEKMAPGDTIVVYLRVQVLTDVNAPATVTNQGYVNWNNVNGGVQPPDKDPNPPDNPVAEVNGISLITVRVSTDSTGAPDSLLSNADPGDTIYYQLKLTNTGNGDDTYTLSNITTSAFGVATVLFFDDADSNGVPDHTTDSTSTGVLAEGAAYRFVACVAVPGGEGDGELDITEIEGVSDEDGTVADTVKVKTTVTAPVLTLIKRVNLTEALSPVAGDTTGTASPGDTLYYTIVLTNTGTGSATTVQIDDDPTNSGESIYAVNTVSVFDGGLGTAGTPINDAANAVIDGVTVGVTINSNTIEIDFDAVNGTGSGQDVWTVRFKATIRGAGATQG